MAIMGPSFKGTIVKDADGKPTGVAAVAPATLVDGAVGAITSLIDGGDSFMVGTAATVKELTKIGVAVIGTSMFTTGSLIPRRQA